MDAKAIAAATAALATFHVSQPAASANDVPSPPGGWDALRSPAPQSTSQPAAASVAPI
jgi:localization factor PodJL